MPELQSVPTASQQKYLRLLERLAEGEIKNGILSDAEITAPWRGYNTLERNINRLESIPHPRPRLAREIARGNCHRLQARVNDSKQESKVVASLQQNTKALLATKAELSGSASAGEGSGLQPTEQYTETCRGRKRGRHARSVTALGPLVGRHRYSFTRAPPRSQRVIRRIAKYATGGHSEHATPLGLLGDL